MSGRVEMYTRYQLHPLCIVNEPKELPGWPDLTQTYLSVAGHFDAFLKSKPFAGQPVRNETVAETQPNP